MHRHLQRLVDPGSEEVDRSLREGGVVLRHDVETVVLEVRRDALLGLADAAPQGAVAIAEARGLVLG